MLKAVTYGHKMSDGLPEEHDLSRCEVKIVWVQTFRQTAAKQSCARRCIYV